MTTILPAPPAEASATRDRLATHRVGELDALRGLAIALVMVRHSFPEVLGAGGIVGVEVFFVLSGFLITHLIVRQQGRGGFDVRRFYRNRAVRLLPALSVALLVNAALDLRSGGDPTMIVGGLMVGLLFMADLTNLLGLPTVAHMNHLWTLAVEEQFYLVWPWVLVAAARRRSSVRATAIAALVVGAGSLAASVVLLDLPEPLYSSPTTWILPLVVGGALALGALRLPTGAPAAIAALAVLVGLAFVPHAKEHAATYLVLVPLVALASATLVANASGAGALAIWRNRWLQGLGLISYSAYLWNQPIAAHVPGGAAIPLTVVVAIASYRLVERPFGRFRQA